MIFENKFIIIMGVYQLRRLSSMCDEVSFDYCLFGDYKKMMKNCIK